MRFEVYQDAAGEWRWRLRSTANGRIMADSAEGYVDERDAMTGISTITYNIGRSNYTVQKVSR